MQKPRNSDMLDKWGDFADTLVIPAIGTFAEYQGEQYAIIGFGAEGDESGITVKARILRVDDEGDDLGFEAILVDFDQINPV